MHTYSDTLPPPNSIPSLLPPYTSSHCPPPFSSPELDVEAITFFFFILIHGTAYPSNIEQCSSDALVCTAYR